ncbi:MAG: DegT/DnrJ/EryC1/StrS family aminotransferase [Planctomycetes bacterium]|nr:DegT/DnrJ/EryC1/StrS family aminotransferase [Planctomycetota bacterium]
MSNASRLALLGGDPALDFPLDEMRRWPVIEEDIVQAVAALLRSGQLSFSPETSFLEERFARFTSTKYALAMTNGTAAIHSAFFSLGVGPGDEVICPTYTYWGSVMEALALGAVPVFADCQRDTAGLCPVHLEKLISPRTRAVIVTHLWGIPADMPSIMRVADAHGIPVIEDASHAHGASIDGRPIGSWGRVAAFSLQSSKPLPSGEGGIMVTSDPDIYERAVLLGHYERIKGLRDGLRSISPTAFGFKYRMSPLSACIARHKLERLDEQNARTGANCRLTEDFLASTGLFRPSPGIPGARRVYYELQVEYTAEEETGVPASAVAAALTAEGLPVTLTRYPLLHRQRVFNEPLHVWGADRPPVYDISAFGPYDDADFPVSFMLQNRMLAFPKFPHADQPFVRRTLAAVEKVVSSFHELRSFAENTVTA